MKRQKVLVGYETIKGVIFAKYEKHIVEDDSSVTPDGIHRETITQEAYDALKRANFVDQVLLDHAKEKHDIAVERDSLKSEKQALLSERQKLIDDKQNLESENIVLKEVISSKEVINLKGVV